ncbi:galectin-2-like isoform X1 [Hemiscyllium ocellatum]|uniref:galectin-2-like isoform X1 n=1 Tax=Hemiscyllium ocellatum TaxID=170820 RepID=UPI00296642FD|nr:galectin-2-like isoform X1 [Hemiscyllium ocellatum]
MEEGLKTEAFEMHNVNLKSGQTLKIKGKITDDADRFAVNLGSNEGHLGLHFNPRFHDDVDGAVIVCNSKCDGCWGSEQREMEFPCAKGIEIKLYVTFKGDSFEIKLPNDHVIEFPNRLSLDKIDYISVWGDFEIASFKFI